MTVKEKLTCKDKVKDSFQNLLDDWLVASVYCGQTIEQLEDKGYDIEVVEDYWYLDWYDGASVLVTDNIVIDLIEQFLEIER